MIDNRPLELKFTRQLRRHAGVFLRYEGRLGEHAMRVLRGRSIVLVENRLLHQLADIELEALVNVWRTIHFCLDWSVHVFGIADGVELERHVVGRGSILEAVKLVLISNR